MTRGRRAAAPRLQPSRCMTREQLGSPWSFWGATSTETSVWRDLLPAGQSPEIHLGTCCLELDPPADKTPPLTRIGLSDRRRLPALSYKHVHLRLDLSHRHLGHLANLGLQRPSQLCTVVIPLWYGHDTPLAARDRRPSSSRSPRLSTAAYSRRSWSRSKSTWRCERPPRSSPIHQRCEAWPKPGSLSSPATWFTAPKRRARFWLSARGELRALRAWNDPPGPARDLGFARGGRSRRGC